MESIPKANVADKGGKPAIDLSNPGVKRGLATYIEVISQVERMHRLILDVIKDEFAKVRILEINPVQGLLLYNIGVSEVSAGELRSRGYYQGSNVSYNLRKLVDAGFMHYERNESDRRSVRVRLTDKGREIHDTIRGMFENGFIEVLEKDVWNLQDCRETRDNLLLLERYWADQIRYIY